MWGWHGHTLRKGQGIGHGHKYLGPTVRSSYNKYGHGSAADTPRDGLTDMETDMASVQEADTDSPTDGDNITDTEQETHHQRVQSWDTDMAPTPAFQLKNTATEHMVLTIIHRIIKRLEEAKNKQKPNGG